MSSLTSSSSQPLPAIAGYTITEQLYWGSRTAVYRAVQDGDQRSVVLKILLSDYPTFGELVQFRNQYAIAKNLNLPGIIHPLNLQFLGNGYVLVMEDWGGLSLSQYLQQYTLNWVEVLKIALQLTTILHNLHQQRVIHKDIKPANILINPESKEIRLIDFSIASLLPKETQEIQNPNILEGTLAYLAPEQTGRMNRGIDYRADYYALGATLYQLLAGQLPFIANDPLEILHCHIAKTAQPVDQVNSSVPRIVGAIVAKLMAKNAEDRYQSALGLQHDLQQCLSQWETTGTITAFELGQRDLSDRFLIPEKLYGREAEVKTLLKSFERVSQGASELMLVTGFSGIGKTAVVNEVHKPITQQKGYFIKGKFDQFNRNIPLSAFVQALRDLMGQLLSESDAQLAQWKSRILEAVGNNGEVLIEVIPELEQVIGHQPVVPELSGTAAQNRFNLLFQKFIQVFTTVNHPLMIFLDDLQWSDSASLQLLKVLMESSGYLLMLGAYRDNEVSPVHPLMLTIGELEKVNLTVNTITLLPLSLKHTNCLVADTLKCSQELSKPLTQLVDRKTQGNPFFTTQFLKALHEDGYIIFDRDQGYWQCDIAQVNALALTDDVVEFMALQLQKLPTATQEILKLAACIGAQFDLSTLAIISQQSLQKVALKLWQAVQEGLIIPQSEMYKFYIGKEGTTLRKNFDITLSYRFCHDRVQQAAYSLISSNHNTMIHLSIGRLLRDSIPSSGWDARIFEIVSHLNRGVDLIRMPDEREQLAYLNQKAAVNAKKSAAFEAAMSYLNTGLGLLTPQCWKDQYCLSLELHQLAAEVAYLLGDSNQQNQLTEIGLKYAHTKLDCLQFHTIKVFDLIAQNKAKDAALYGIQVLNEFGIYLPKNPSQAQVGLGLLVTAGRILVKSLNQLLKSPVMSNSEKYAICNFLNIIGTSAATGIPKLFPLIIFKLTALNLKYGYSPGPHLVILGFIFCEKLGRFQFGYELGKVAIELCHKDHEKAWVAPTYFLWNFFIAYRKTTLRQSLPSLLEAYQIGLDVGNLEYSANSLLVYFSYTYWSGNNLADLQKEMIASNAAMQKLNQKKMICLQNMYCQILENLVVYRDNVCEIRGQFFNEFMADDSFVKAWLNIEKLTLAVIFGYYAELRDYLKSIDTLLEYVDGTIGARLYEFYSALALLLQKSKQSPSQRKSDLRHIQTSRKTLTKLAKSAPANFLHKKFLLDAEYHRVNGQYNLAIHNYDLAISHARTNLYTQEEGLANELAAKFYLDWGKQVVAAGYMQEAYYCYTRWGAKSKVVDLENRYPQLLQPILQETNQRLTILETLSSSAASTYSLHPSFQTNLSTSTHQTLDLSKLLQTSQIFVSTIKLDELLRVLTQTMLENSGADQCVLMLCEDSQWQIRVIADLEKMTLLSSPLDCQPNIPTKLIQYVKNTMTTVVIDDLRTSLPIIDDYLNFHQPKSILCLPMINQGRLRAILYLENRLASGAFTHKRIGMLNFLCTQAAISLENARLYEKSQLYAQQLEQSQLQMVQSEKMASLGNLVAGVAHEINNPIGFLNGSINNGKEHVQDLLEHLALYQQHYPSPTSPIQDHAEDIDLEYVCEDLPQLLNSMQGATDRIKGISTSLRTFSRADTEYKVSANLHEGIDSTLLILKYRLKANANRPEIEVVTNYGEIPPIDCFPGQLNQVFMNILANAIDMFDEMAQGQSFQDLEAHPQQITISTALVDDQVQITIRDNGKGMTEEVKSRIFDHLFTTKSVGKGTGLGLAIAQQIVVDKHGGSLVVESELGQGSEFLIRLPING